MVGGCTVVAGGNSSFPMGPGASLLKSTSMSRKFEENLASIAEWSGQERVRLGLLVDDEEDACCSTCEYAKRTLLAAGNAH